MGPSASDFKSRLEVLLRRPLHTLEFTQELLLLVLESLEVERAGFWRITPDGLVCSELFAAPRRFKTVSISLPPVSGCALRVPWEETVILEACVALLSEMEHEGRRPPPREVSGERRGATAPSWCARLYPLAVGGARQGILKLRFHSSDPGAASRRAAADSMAETLPLVIALHDSQRALAERVKEQTCLYDILHFLSESERELGELLQGIAERLPRACQYPEVAEAQVVFDDRVYRTGGFDRVRSTMSGEIVRGEVRRGRVDVGYTEERPALHESPFLPEEWTLVEAVARDVGLIAERLEAQERKARLEEQLRHADRLATLGQLAAGVAHELNEPLANALGFAQLAQKAPALTPQAEEDLERVIDAVLRARDTIRRLLLFARQTPPDVVPFDLNELLDDVLKFFEGRFRRQGIDVIRDLASSPLPLVKGDRGQIRQVLVNLVVNSIQAMPDGGQITLLTRSEGARVVLAVADDGCGMSAEVQRQAFLPFFTTKDVHEGTGLGLSVVHGIVTAHHGSIRLESAPMAGSLFEVTLPAEHALGREEA